MFALAAAVIGPARDYTGRRNVPRLGCLFPGSRADSRRRYVYALLVVVGHAVMRMVSGPAQCDSLAALGWPAEGSPK